MSLELTPVHRNLHTKVTFLGLEFEDLILVLALAALMNLACALCKRQRACIRHSIERIYGVCCARAGRAVPDSVQVRAASRISHRPGPIVLRSEGMVRT